MAVRATDQLKELASAGQPPDISRREFARRTSTGVWGLGAAGCMAMAIPDAGGSDVPQVESTGHQDGTGAVFHKYNESRLMRGYPPPIELRVTKANYFSSEEHLRWAFTNGHRALFNTEVMLSPQRRIWPLPRRDVNCEQINAIEVSMHPNGGKVTVGKWLQDHRTDFFAVMHNGEIVTEQYFRGMKPETPHWFWSLTKSWTTTILAKCIEDRILSRDMHARQLVPELGQTSLRDATVGDLLDQRTGIDWKQGTWDFTRPEELQIATDRPARHHRLAGYVPRNTTEPLELGVYDMLLEKGQPQRATGRSLHYSEHNFYALALIASRVTGKSMPDLFRETLLEGLGFEFPAFWMHDGLGAYDPGGGLFVTGRDTLRWGNMLLHGGRVDNKQVVSEQFLDDITLAAPHCEIDPGSDIYKMLPVGTRYRSGFYVSPTDNPTAPIIAGVGAFGQWCLIDYKRKNVMVKLGTDSDYSKPMEELDFRALVSLSGNLGKTIA